MFSNTQLWSDLEVALITKRSPVSTWSVAKDFPCVTTGVCPSLNHSKSNALLAELLGTDNAVFDSSHNWYEPVIVKSGC